MPTATRYPGGRWCPQDEFECSNHLCVSQSWVCDGADDCGDDSDEQLSLCREFVFTILYLNFVFPYKQCMTPPLPLCKQS